MIDFLGKLFSLARRYRTRLVLGILCGILSGLLNSALMVVVKLVIGVVFPSADAPSLTSQMERAPEFVRSLVGGIESALPRAAASGDVAVKVAAITLIPLVMFLRGLSLYLSSYCMQWVAIRAVMDLRARLFNHLVNLSLAFFHRISPGDLMSRVTNDTSVLLVTLNHSIPVLVKDPITVLGLAVLVVTQQPSLTFVSMLALPFCMVPIIVFSRRVRRASEAMQTNYAELSGLLHEAFTSNRIIKAYNLEPRVQQQFSDVSRRFVSQYMRVIRSYEISGPLIETLGAVSVALVFYYIALWAKTSMTPGDLMQFVGSIFLMYQPIKSMTRLHSQLEQARAATGRIFEILEIQPSVAEPKHPAPLRSERAEIRFESIDFTYEDRPVLRGIDLTIQPGHMVALVGGSGSGKTTLTNLLLRFYDPQLGVVRIGGTDIRQVSLHDLREQIAVVTQDTILFNDTIRNNITLGRPGASGAEIEAAACKAHAHEFILEKPQGYETVVGDKGATLSGGQRQRLAIARAILKNAPILVLDEATSALDSESERAVQAGLAELMQGRTTICIAHRLSTIQSADLIVVLDQGRLVEQGKHEELIRHGGVYQKLYALQFAP
jgi:subfamily B ATP-binding cassette protein MsbA